MLKFWKRLNELYAWLMIAAFGFLTLIGVWQTYDDYYMFYHTHMTEKAVLQYKPDPALPNAQENSPILDEMVAWLTIDDTNIDFPIMQAEDNIRFLNTDPFGEYSLSGSIFLDHRCSADFSDAYSVIYGHHMDYGKMFGALDDFLKESYLVKHTAGTLLVGRNAEQVYPLEIFASMQVNARNKIVFDMQQDQIRDYIHENASVLTHEQDAKILCLSTCAGADLDTRIVVFCYIGKS